MPVHHIRGCAVCESYTRALICPSCTHASFLDEKRKTLESLEEEKNVLLRKLDRLLEQKEAGIRKALQRRDVVERLQEQRLQAERLRALLAEGCHDRDILRDNLTARKEDLAHRCAALQKARTEMLGNQFPTLIRCQSLTLSHMTGMLLKEQRLKVRQLLSIFPFRINAVSKTHGPIQVTICNLRLPENMQSLTHSLQQPQDLAAALGYLLLLTELLACYLGGPVLHESSFCGSSSTIWQASGFHQEGRDCSRAACLYPLYLTAPSINLGGVGAPSTRPSTPNSFLSGLSRATSLGSVFTGFETDDGSLLADSPTIRSRSIKLRQGYELLQASLACLAKDRGAALNLQLPQGWTPIAQLVLLCTWIKKDIRADGRLVAASRMSETVPGDGFSVLMTAGGQGGQVLAQNLWTSEDEEDEDLMREWENVGPAPLPPPPSEPEEVEHWTRAMFTDASLGPGSGALGPGQMLSIESIRTLFSRQ